LARVAELRSFPLKKMQGLGFLMVVSDFDTMRKKGFLAQI